MIREKLKDSLKLAMKAGETIRVSTIRLILAAIKDRDIAARANGDDNNLGIKESEILELLNKMLKQRNETASTYEKAGREDLASQEKKEGEIIASFMPVQLNEEELTLAVGKAIENCGASTIREMGKVMEYLKMTYAGKCDFQKASIIVRQRLGS